MCFPHRNTKNVVLKKFKVLSDCLKYREKKETDINFINKHRESCEKKVLEYYSDFNKDFDFNELLTLSLHEGLPGHHYQMERLIKSKIPDYLKYFDNGLFLYLGYAHTDREMAHMMTSSIIFSSAVRMPVFDHLTPVNSRSHYEIEHSFDYALTWKGNIFGNLETSIGLNGFRQSGNPYSYTFRGDLSGYRTDGENIELLYVPSIDDPNVIYSDGFDTDAFEQFLQDSGLSAYRGTAVPRNSFNSPWAGTFDLRIAQELPFGGVPGKATFFLDIENVLNLINSDWGGFENYVGSTSNSRGIVEAEVDDQGRYVYKTFKIDGEPTQNIGKSVYQIKVGLKYQF